MPAACSGFYFIRPSARTEAFMADWLAAAYIVSEDGTVVWEQRRFSDLLRATPQPVRSALTISFKLARRCMPRSLFTMTARLLHATALINVLLARDMRSSSLAHANCGTLQSAPPLRADPSQF